MIYFMVVLAVLSGLALLVGTVWVLVVSGQTIRRSGEEVGAEIVADRVSEHGEAPLVEKRAFNGAVGSVGREVTLDFAEVKANLKAGRWDGALPVLLAVGGLLGLLFFGSLALFLAMEDKLVGGLIAAVSIFAVLRILLGMARA